MWVAWLSKRVLAARNDEDGAAVVSVCLSYLDDINRVNASDGQNGSCTRHTDLGKKTRRSSGSSGHDVGVLIQAHCGLVVAV